MKGNKEDKGHRDTQGITRRSFIKSVGAGAATVATSGTLSAFTVKNEEVLKQEELHKVTLKINGRDHSLLVEPRWSLLFVLRENLGLTGTKIGCDRGECGACTVLIDGAPRYACMTLALEAEASKITTIEGLMEGEKTGLIQQAFVENDAFQCGYCTPGQIVAAQGLLNSNPNPSLEQIREGMSGNLCRCGAYKHIFQAVQTAAKNSLIK